VAAALLLTSFLRGFSPFSSLAEQLSLIQPRSEIVVDRSGDATAQARSTRTSGPLRIATATTAAANSVEPTAGPAIAIAPDLSGQPTPEPAPTAPGAPTASSAPPSSSAPSTPTASGPFAGSSASISDPTPATGGNVTVSLRLVRDGQPLAAVPVYAVAHYRTVSNLRWPSASGTVLTNKDGVADITANIGNATRGFEVKVEMIATVDGAPQTWTTSFTPR
jgi:hypothetical protein